MKVIRLMRGGSQPFLVKGSDEACYVTKFSGNPQGDRTLINEFIAGHLLRRLGVSTPDLRILRLEDCCEGREQLYFSTDRQEPIASGLHLGSKCPVDPEKTAIFDYLPSSLYSRVANLDDLGVVFSFDQWTAHLDPRQTIFARQRRAGKPVSAPPKQTLFTCWIIDNGMCFGRNWTLKPHPLYAYHPILDIYSHFKFQECASRGAQLIQSLPNSEFDGARQGIPPEWFARGDSGALDAMFDALQHRQGLLVNRLPDYLKAIRSLRN